MIVLKKIYLEMYKRQRKRTKIGFGFSLIEEIVKRYGLCFCFTPLAVLTRH